MLPADLLTGPLPAGMAFVVVLLGLGLRFLKQRDESKRSEWDRMRDLLDELRDQRDQQDERLQQKDDLIEKQAAHITELRHDLREALKHYSPRQPGGGSSVEGPDDGQPE